VNEIDGVYLYDIDSLEATVRQTLEVRGREVARCEGIIGRHVEEFVGWMDRRRAGAGGRGAMPGGEGVFAP
jgi:glutamyl-tRNA reductase